MMILVFQANRIVRIEGLENLTELRDLYLSDNGIEEIGGLEQNVSASVENQGSGTWLCF